VSTPSRPRLTLFRAEGAPLREDMMYFAQDQGDALRRIQNANEAGFGDGHALTCLYRSPDPKGVSLCWGWFRPGYITPRHSHDADCIYYLLGGTLQVGATVLGQGDGVFVPASATYTLTAGPEGAQLLEFRNATHFDVSLAAGGEGHWAKLLEAVQANHPRWTDGSPPPGPQVHATALPPGGH